MSKHVPRFFLKKDIANNIQEGDFLTLSPQQMHHATNVLRLKTGDEIKIFNEKIGEWNCDIFNIKKCMVRCKMQNVKPEVESEIGIIVVFSLINPNKMSLLLEKVTELGATEIVPIISQYTQQKKLNKERAEQIIISASEQCGRLSIPKIHDPQNLRDFLDNYNKYNYKCDLLVADEALRNENTPQITTTITIPSSTSSADISYSHNQYAFLVGPEGGFSDEERASFRRYPFVKSISLGKNILRSETAAIAIMAAITVPFIIKTSR